MRSRSASVSRCAVGCEHAPCRRRVPDLRLYSIDAVDDAAVRVDGPGSASKNRSSASRRSCGRPRRAGRYQRVGWCRRRLEDHVVARPSSSSGERPADLWASSPAVICQRTVSSVIDREVAREGPVGERLTRRSRMSGTRIVPAPMKRPAAASLSSPGPRPSARSCRNRRRVDTRISAAYSRTRRPGRRRRRRRSARTGRRLAVGLPIRAPPSICQPPPDRQSPETARDDLDPRTVGDHADPFAVWSGPHAAAQSARATAGSSCRIAAAYPLLDGMGDCPIL